MANPSETIDQNLLPVQAYFDVYGNFQTFIGQNKPFFASINPYQSGLHITNSTIDSTTIGATTPSTGIFTNISATTGQLLTSPVANTDIANKLYVDTIAQGLAPKAACKVATLTNITLSGLQTIDGYTTLSGDRVLVKNQGTQSENGIYIASASAWTRAVDMDVWAEVPGAYTVILNGSQANTAWVSTSPDTGTINVTPITFVLFSGVSVYYAGTGLSLSSNTFSITNTGVTAGVYGSTSSVGAFQVNAQGQLTLAQSLPIQITPSQVTGLGTMATQNANNVAITGGSINGTPIGDAARSSGKFSSLDLSDKASLTWDLGSNYISGETGSGMSIGTNGYINIAQTNPAYGGPTNIVRFDEYGSLGLGTTTPNQFAPGYQVLALDGSLAGLIDLRVAGTTQGIFTADTNGVQVIGPAGVNLVVAGDYQLQIGTSGDWTINGSQGAAGQMLISNGVGLKPSWSGAPDIRGGSINNCTIGAVSPNTGSFTTLNVTTALTLNSDPGTAGQVLTSAGAGNLPTWTNAAVGTVTSVSGTGTVSGITLSGTVTSTGNLTLGGSLNLSAPPAIGGTTPNSGSFTSLSFNSTLTVGGSTGTTGQVLTSQGSGSPIWTTPTSYATVTDDTTTNATRYPLFANQTTGNLTTEYTSSTKYQFNPFTGLLTATGFSGSGANLTSLPAGQLSGTIPSGVLGNSTLYIGTTAVALNAASGSITSLAVNISGSAGSATTATTATNANNVAVTDNTSSSATWYPAILSTTTGNLPVTTSSTKLSFVPSTGILTATGFTGSFNGSIGSTTPNAGTFTTVDATTVTANGFGVRIRQATGGLAKLQLTNNAANAELASVSHDGSNLTISSSVGNTIVGTLQFADGSTQVSHATPQVTTYTSGSGTYTVPTNAKYIIVRMIGGGGSGGGSTGTTAGGGGGAGGYLEGLITNPSSTYSYAVGAASGTTTFGSALFSAGGGSAGTSSTTASSGGTGGSSSGGYLNLTGATGGFGWASLPYFNGGMGAGSPFGSGGSGGGTGYGNGFAAINYGSGGGGAVGGGGAGGGGGGLIIVTAYF